MRNKIYFYHSNSQTNSYTVDTSPISSQTVSTFPILDIKGNNIIGTSTLNKNVTIDSNNNKIITYELSVIFSNTDIPGNLTLHFDSFISDTNLNYDNNYFMLGTFLGTVVGTQSSGHFLNSSGIVTLLVQDNDDLCIYEVSFSNTTEHDCSNDFLWGASTSAFQIEGTSNSFGRGLTIWDTFINTVPSPIADGSNADIACNSYIQYKDDIKSLKMLNANSYRFSIAWSRIFPNGKGEINQLGVEHYNNVINECLLHNITPVVCLYHWDLPQALQDEYNGWLCKNTEICIDFANYAELCFKLYGDRVKYWATINEPQTIAVDCYEYNYFAPAAGTSDGNSIYGYEYTVGHNLLISHAYAVNIYKTKFSQQNGKIGIICNMDWAEPYTNSKENIDASERRNIFWGGWFWDPIFFGDYPEIMKTLVGDRLPKFTNEQKQLIQGSIDMMLLNTYSAEYIYSQNYSSANLVGWTYDQQTGSSYYSSEGVIIGKETQSSWLHIVPWAVNKLLLWIQNRYGYDGCGTGIGIYKNGVKTQIPLMITENGMDIKGQTQDTSYVVAKNDIERIYYYDSYISNIAEAVKVSGIDFKGYFPWSLLDNFEWASAYTCRFGLFYLKCNTGNYIARQPKDSVEWYKNYISKNPNGPKAIQNETTCDFYNIDKNASSSWEGGPIRGYYYWSNNFYLPPFTSETPELYCLDTITVPQTNINPPTNYTNITQNAYPIQYSNSILNDSNYNSVFLFTQYTNYNDIMKNADITTMYNNTISYFSNKNIYNYLIGLSFGSGVIPSSPPIEGEGDGFFTLGQNGSIASIYTAVTPINQKYTYTQSNNDVITITGSGNYTYSSPTIALALGTSLQPGQYNCIVFDIELATTSGPETVMVSDFINLFKYIKKLYPDMIIISAISHNCSYYIPELSSQIIKSELSDYIAPILYSQMFGTVNEYLANSNLSWHNFFNNLLENPKFIKYGLNYLLPNIYAGYSFTSNGSYILDLYNHGGTNTTNPPNLYYYQSSSSANNEVTETYGEMNESLDFYKKDKGVVDFFNKLVTHYNIKTNIIHSTTLGGFVQWSNYKSS